MEVEGFYCWGFVSVRFGCRIGIYELSVIDFGDF